MAKQAAARKPPNRFDVRNWLTRTEAAKALECSEGLIRFFERRQKLHPVRDADDHPRYDPAELHVLAARRQQQKRGAAPRVITGQVASRVYKLLDKYEREDKLDRAHREIVKRVKITPEDAQRLFDNWLLPFEEARSVQREAEEQARRERQEEREAGRLAAVEAQRLRAQTASAAVDVSMFETLTKNLQRRKGSDKP